MAHSSVCLFAAHFRGDDLPKYTRSLLQELNKHCERLVLITESKNWTTQSADFLQKSNIEVLFSPNKGFDFGKWYWGFKKLKLANTERIILMNDSMLLLSSLENFFHWCSNSSASVKGFLSSNERGAHLQSYLLVIESPAIASTLKYFKRKKRYRSKRKVIRNYELGLSTFWKKKGYVLEAFHDIANFDKNPNYFFIKELLAQRTPLIKRHILMDSFGEDMRNSLREQGFNFSKEHYLDLIKENYTAEEYQEALEISLS